MTAHTPTRRLVPVGRRHMPPPTQPQLSLLEPVEDSSIEGRFRRFHERHPEVYDQLVVLARQAKAAGRPRVGMGLLFEVLRWHAFIARDAQEEFRLNNIYRAPYARLIMEQEPDLDGFFTTRESPHKDRDA